MKIDVSQCFRIVAEGGGELMQVNMLGYDPRGNPVTKQTNNPVTLKTICVNALLDSRNETENTTGEEKLSRLKLAENIQQAKEPIDIAEADICLLKTLINKVNSALVVGQAYRMLDTSSK